MPLVTQAEIERARQVDLLSYLQQAEPDELVPLGRNYYCTREHDSLKISNGKWYWFSRDIGGVSALDYLIKVRNMPLPQAVDRKARPNRDLLNFWRPDRIRKEVWQQPCRSARSALKYTAAPVQKSCLLYARC